MEPLRTVTTSELSRNPKKVLERVLAGERLVVACHKKPLATLQPLDGFVIQPGGRTHDIYGWPIGGALEEAHKLSAGQQDMLVWGVNATTLKPGRVCPPHNFGELVRGIEAMALKGLVRKTRRGWDLTGRGMALREALVLERGENLENCWPRPAEWYEKLCRSVSAGSVRREERLQGR